MPKCECGCGEHPLGATSEFKQGHDAKHMKNLKIKIREGQAAYAEMLRRGWLPQEVTV
jgi:hypothetical protein